jgi:hypothetical protein
MAAKRARCGIVSRVSLTTYDLHFRGCECPGNFKGMFHDAGWAAERLRGVSHRQERREMFHVSGCHSKLSYQTGGNVAFSKNGFRDRKVNI